MSDNTAGILKKINKKIDELASDKAAAKELKAEIKELASASIESDVIKEQLKAVCEKLDNLETKNISLKESVYDLVSSTAKSLETFAKSDDEENARQLLDFLKDLDKKIDNLSERGQKNSFNFSDGGEQFQKIKDELNFFHNELETRMNDNFAGIEETIGKIITEIHDKMTDLQEAVETNSEKLITDLISDVKQLKSDTVEIAEDIRAIDNAAIKNTENKLSDVIENSQKYTEKIINEVNKLKDVTAKADVLEAKNKETIEIFKNELASVRNNIHSQIREVLSKIAVQDEIKFLCEEAAASVSHNSGEIGVIQKYLKDLKNGDEKQGRIFEEIQTILTELSEYELNENADKIDIMYENLTMLNTWAGKSDKLTENFDMLREDFDLNSDKIDIIYENLTFINEWVKTLDKFAKDIDTLKEQCETSIHLPEKIDDIASNIAAVKEWGKKADALALQVRALSVQISETESTVNSKNLADMKTMFAQLTEDMANVSSRTNKLIIESDKANDVLQGHLINLQSLISALEEKSANYNIERIAPKLEELKYLSEKRSGFDKIFTESFGYLAEWIDAAGTTISSIKNELTELQLAHKQQTDLISESQDKQIQQISQFEDEQVATWAGIQEIQKLNIKKIQEHQISMFAQLTEQQNQKLIQLQEQQEAQIKLLQEQQTMQLNRIKEDQSLLFNQFQNMQTQLLNNFIEQQNAKMQTQIEQITNLMQNQFSQVEQIKNDIIKNTTESQSGTEVLEENLNDISLKIEQNNQNNMQKINDLTEKIDTVIAADISDHTNNNLLAQKIDSLEAKINSIEQYMEMIIEFLEED